MPENPNPFAHLPEQDADPVAWDPQRRQFVPHSPPPTTTAASPPAPPAPPSDGNADGRDPRRFFVGASAVGQAPPPRAGVDAPAPPPPAAPPLAPPGPAPAPGPRPAPGRTPATPAKKPGRRRWWQRKRNWILLICVLLPFLLLAGGLIYADIKFRQIHRVPVGSLLDSGGSGTNVLIVGSDSR